MIIYGHNLYGRVHDVVVEGRSICYVVTRFYHLYFIPLIPASSHIVLSGSEDGSSFRGVEIPMSGSSILVAWMRTLSLFLIIGGLCFYFSIEPNAAHAGADRAVSFLEVIGGIALYALTSFIGRASQARVVELLQHLGVVDPALLSLAAESASPGAPGSTNPHAESGMSTMSMVIHGALGLGIMGLGYGGYSYLTRPAPTPVAAVNATATPSATPTPTQGESYLKTARKAFASKKFQDAAIQGELAAEFLNAEKAPTSKQIEAHKIAGQSYYKRKDYGKALKHYKSLAGLDPGNNKQYAPVIGELAQHVPAARTEGAPLRLTDDQVRRREEARLNKVIPVRIVGPYDNPGFGGRVEHMTVREYERRQREER